MQRPPIRSMLASAVQCLCHVSTTPRLDAEILLAHVMGYSRAQLSAHSNVVPSEEHITTFASLLARRLHREPVAYLVGHREFYGCDMLVDQRVLIPRPETELLVDMTRTLIDRAIFPSPLRLVDVGTGSGSIAIALALHLPQAHIYATDCSADALAVATMNIKRHHVEHRVTLFQGDLLEPVPKQIDVIVSNPPYTILLEIDEGVYRYEPHLALDGGSDGLEVYRRLLAQAPQWLQPTGAVVLEIGATQAAAVCSLAKQVFPLAHITVHQDLAGNDRVVVVEHC